jgi:hypothetical protein
MWPRLLITGDTNQNQPLPPHPLQHIPDMSATCCSLNVPTLSHLCAFAQAVLAPHPQQSLVGAQCTTRWRWDFTLLDLSFCRVRIAHSLCKGLLWEFNEVSL